MACGNSWAWGTAGSAAAHSSYWTRICCGTQVSLLYHFADKHLKKHFQLNVICKFSKRTFYSIIWATAENIGIALDPEGSLWHLSLYTLLCTSHCEAQLLLTEALQCSFCFAVHISGWVLFIISLTIFCLYFPKPFRENNHFHLTVFKT